MKLSEFLLKRQWSKEEAARTFGVGIASIYRYLSEKKPVTPSSKVIARIVHETGGLVGISDLIREQPKDIKAASDGKTVR